MNRKCDVSKRGSQVDVPSSIVLNFLKLIDRTFWRARRKNSTVVKPGWHLQYGSVMDRIDSAQFWKACSADI